MSERIKQLEYEFELQPGERLALPPAVLAAVGPGRWVITIENVMAQRDHSAFLAGYAVEDEGLYE